MRSRFPIATSHRLRWLLAPVPRFRMVLDFGKRRASARPIAGSCLSASKVAWRTPSPLSVLHQQCRGSGKEEGWRQAGQCPPRLVYRGQRYCSGQDHPIRIELQLCHLARGQASVVEFGRLFRNGEGLCRFGEARNRIASRAMGGQPTRSFEALRDDFLTCQT